MMGNDRLLTEEGIGKLLQRAHRHSEDLPNVIELRGRTLVVGDLHGDLTSARSAIREFDGGDYRNILFLGDYVDRGPESVRVMNMLLEQNLERPDEFHLLRGNHEILWVNTKFGFKDELERRGLGGLHGEYNRLFPRLPVAALLDGRAFAVHGGIPEGDPTLSAIRRMDRRVEDPEPDGDPLIMGLLWNDPDETVREFGPNPTRGYMKAFGKAPFERFMERNGLDLFVRAHQKWGQGHNEFFDGRLVSIFSSDSYGRRARPQGAVVEDLRVTYRAL